MSSGVLRNPAGRFILWALFFLGLGDSAEQARFSLTISIFLACDRFISTSAGREYTELGFRTPFLYKLVRHPIMLGFIIAFWATPDMTVGHLLFALVTTAYILIAIQLEERDIVSVHGTDYEEYRKQVSMLLPIPKKRSKSESISASNGDQH